MLLALTFGLEDEQVLWVVPGRGDKQEVPSGSSGKDPLSCALEPAQQPAGVGQQYLGLCVHCCCVCLCLFTQWDAAEAKLCVLIGCAFHGKRFCLSLLLHHSPSLCCMASSDP